MQLAHRWSDRSLTRIELTMVVLIFTLLIGMLSRHTLIIFARAEKTFVDSTVININTALRYYTITLLMENNVEALEKLSQLNPMSVVASEVSLSEIDIGELDSYINAQQHSWLPNKYLGEFDAPDLDLIEEGYWYFDTSQKMLIYRVNNTEYFSSELEGIARIRYKTEIEFDDKNNNQLFEYDIDKLTGIKFINMDEYQWNI